MAVGATRQNPQRHYPPWAALLGFAGGHATLVGVDLPPRVVIGLERVGVGVGAARSPPLSAPGNWALYNKQEPGKLTKGGMKSLRRKTYSEMLR